MSPTSMAHISEGCPATLPDGAVLLWKDQEKAFPYAEPKLPPRGCPLFFVSGLKLVKSLLPQ